MHVAALIVGTVTEDDYSHWAAVQSLGEWLEKAGVPGITGVDTRAVTKHLRTTGCMLGKVMVGGADPNSIEWDDVNARNMVAEVSIPKPMSYSSSGDVDILVVDCGLRHAGVVGLRRAAVGDVAALRSKELHRQQAARRDGDRQLRRTRCRALRSRSSSSTGV